MSHSLPSSAQVHPSPSAPPVHFFGYLHASTGLGEAARLILRSLRASGVQVIAHHVPLRDRDDVPSAGETVPISSNTLPPEGSLCILCLDPRAVLHFTDIVHPSFFTGSCRHVAIWFWELNAIPRTAVEASRLINEVWVVSPFLQEAFSNGLQIPVKSFRQPIDAAALQHLQPLDTPGINGRFTFLFSFAYDSYGPRKNPAAACAAFAEAFPHPTENGPVLIIKSTKASDTIWRSDHTRMLSQWQHRPDIFFIDGVMSDQERMALTQRCDCYVSLHRSEGLGLTLLEAMALGKPCIATGYSGNLSFMNGDNSALVLWTPTTEGLHSPPYNDLPGAEWAEPDVSAAAAAMQRIYTDEAYRNAIAQQALADIRSLHSPKAVGQQLLALINSCQPASPASASASAASSAPATTTATIQEQPASSPPPTPIESVYSRATKALKAIKTETKTGTGRQHEQLLTQLVDVCQLALRAMKDKEKTLVTLGRDINHLFQSFPLSQHLDLPEDDLDDPWGLHGKGATSRSTETFHTKATRSLNAFKADLKKHQEERASAQPVAPAISHTEQLMLQLTDCCQLALKAVKEKEDLLITSIKDIDHRIQRIEHHLEHVMPTVEGLVNASAPRPLGSDWSRLGISSHSNTTRTEHEPPNSVPSR